MKGFCDIFPDWCDPPRGGPPRPDRPSPMLIALEEKLSDPTILDKYHYIDLLEGAKALKSEGLDDYAEMIFRALPSIAKLKKDVRPIDVSTGLIEYARFLDSKPERRDEATMLMDMALLNLYQRV